MVSDNDNKGKEHKEDDPQDPKPEEVKSEAEEEVEETPSACPRATVASIRVVANSLKLKRGARMSTGGRVPRHSLASRTPASGIKNHFHTLIHDYQHKKVPHRDFPSMWDINRSNHA